MQQYDSAQTLLQQQQFFISPIYFAVLEIDGSYWKNVTGTHTPNYEVFESVLKTILGRRQTGKYG